VRYWVDDKVNGGSKTAHIKMMNAKIDTVRDGLMAKVESALIPAQSTSTAEIMDDLANITYSATTHTVESRISVHEDDFEDFENFPLIVVAPGDEDCEEQANLITQTNFHPEVHFFIEDTSTATLEGWRDDIRNAIYRDETLRSHILMVSIDEIILTEPEDRKLQHLAFMLTIVFDITHT